MKFATKLHLVSALLIAIASLLGTIGIVGIRLTNAGLETVYNDRVVPLKQLKSIADDYAVSIIDAANKANAGLVNGKDTLAAVEASTVRIQREWSAYMATRLTPEEAKLAQEAAVLFTAADAAVESFRTFLSTHPGDLRGLLVEHDGPLYASIDPISAKITELVELQLRVAQEQYALAQARFRSILWLMVTLLATGTLAGGGVGWLVVRGATRTLSRVVMSLNEGAHQTAVAASQVSAASQTLAEGASEQAASLEETSASLEEMTSRVQRNADAASNAMKLAKDARAAADTGATEMAEMQSAMNDIKVSSADVAKIVKDIDEIAFQTNILALNAAVEAARAGEAGMGFAVVADEVRSLAQRSATSAKQTANKIDEAISRSERGAQISARLAVSFGQIAGKTREVDHFIADIASASNEQSQGLHQVNAAVTQMDQVTQNNAASAEESASAAEELGAQAASVRESVRALTLLLGNSSPAMSVSESSSDRPSPGIRNHLAPAQPSSPAQHHSGSSRTAVHRSTTVPSPTQRSRPHAESEPAAASRDF